MAAHPESGAAQGFFLSEGIFFLPLLPVEGLLFLSEARKCRDWDLTCTNVQPERPGWSLKSAITEITQEINKIDYLDCIQSDWIF